MTLLQLTPGAGAMYCGNCLRDNALVGALRKLGHQVLMVPLYLPLRLDEPDQSAGTPVFFSGIKVYLGQKSALFRGAPDWLRDVFGSPSLLQWAGGKAARTRPQDLGELTLSMLRGEAGNQARELGELLAWLKGQPRPDVICLSNALLLGLANRLKRELRAPVVCSLQGEDTFLDALPEPYRAQCWQTLAERTAVVDVFVAPSRYFGNLMRERLGFPAEKLRVVFNGIDLSGYGDECRLPSDAQAPFSSSPATRHPSPVLGFFARMCREKGLDTLVEAYVILRRRGRVKDLKLRLGGGCGPAEEPVVEALRERLAAEGLLEDVEFWPNLDRPDKLAFLQGLSVFSVPALYGEAFGLYVVEALAAGVPVVQPRTAAFTELVEATGGGLLCAPGDPEALAEAIEQLLLAPERARALGDAGRRAVFEQFSAEAMASRMLKIFSSLPGANVSH
jgi:glycosyltransferase involved in cell wall biosynthesis